MRGIALALAKRRAMSLLLWTLLPPPWKYCAAVMPVAGFFAGRWLWRRRRRR